MTMRNRLNEMRFDVGFDLRVFVNGFYAIRASDYCIEECQPKFANVSSIKSRLSLVSFGLSLVRTFEHKTKLLQSHPVRTFRTRVQTWPSRLDYLDSSCWLRIDQFFLIDFKSINDLMKSPNFVKVSTFVKIYWDFINILVSFFPISSSCRTH